jgi:flagellum-specific ATP synthase
VLHSVSRLIGEVVSPEVRSAGTDVRGMLAALRDKEDLIAIGAYQPGSDPATDAALERRAAIQAFLRQGIDEPSTAEEADAGLLALPTTPIEAEELPAELLAAEPPPPPAPGPSAIPPLHLSI